MKNSWEQHCTTTNTHTRSWFDWYSCFCSTSKPSFFMLMTTTTMMMTKMVILLISWRHQMVKWWWFTHRIKYAKSTSWMPLILVSRVRAPVRLDMNCLTPPHFNSKLAYLDFFTAHLLFNDRTYQVAGGLLAHVSVHWIENVVLSKNLSLCELCFLLCTKSSTNFNMHHVIYLKFQLSIGSENCFSPCKRQSEIK